MFSSSGKRWRRGLVSLVAAYALILQAFLAYSAVAQADAQSLASGGGDLFVICSHSGDAAPGDSLPANADHHCPLCTLAMSGAGVVPATEAQAVVRLAIFRRMAFVSADACISFHQVRAGLSRAPPQNA